MTVKDSKNNAPCQQDITSSKAFDWLSFTRNDTCAGKLTYQMMKIYTKSFEKRNPLLPTYGIATLAIRYQSAIVIPDSEETLMLAEESRSKMLLKQKDPMIRPTKVEVPKELPKVSMVNTSLKKLKYHLAGFDVVIKERTTPTAITEGSWGFEHTKACFRDEIIPFLKALKDLFNTFDQYLIDKLSEVQNVFNKDIVNIIMNSSVDIASVNMHECEKCLKLETELLNKKDFVEKEIYDKLKVLPLLKNIASL
ncbi:hypothetical protein Tco_0746971 [Tanacetum coccineum]